MFDTEKDVVFLTCDGELPVEYKTKITSELEELFSDKKVVILEHGLRLDSVYDNE